MSITVRVPVADPDAQLLTYDTINLYSDTAVSGDFLSLASSTPLVSGTTEYAISDPAGDANTLYRYTFFRTAPPAESLKSAIIFPEATTLLRLRMEAARHANVGFSGTCSAGGTSTTLVDDQLSDTGVDPAFLQGSWVYRPDAAANDRVRRVKQSGFDPIASDLSFDRRYTIAPVQGERYQVFGLVPPIDQVGIGYSWDRAVRAGLAMCWWVDELNLGAGDGKGHQFSLGPFSVDDVQLRSVFLRYTDALGAVRNLDASKLMRYWKVVQGGPSLLLELNPAPAVSQEVIATVNMRDPGLYLDSDFTTCPFDYAVRGTVVALFTNLNTRYSGKYAGELGAALADFSLEDAVHFPSDTFVGV